MSLKDVFNKLGTDARSIAERFMKFSILFGLDSTAPVEKRKVVMLGKWGPRKKRVNPDGSVTTYREHFYNGKKDQEVVLGLSPAPTRTVKFGKGELFLNGEKCCNVSSLTMEVSSIPIKDFCARRFAVPYRSPSSPMGTMKIMAYSIRRIYAGRNHVAR